MIVEKLGMSAKIICTITPKGICPVALEGSALRRNTLVTALLHDRNRTIPFGLIVPAISKNALAATADCFFPVKEKVPCACVAYPYNTRFLHLLYNMITKSIAIFFRDESVITRAGRCCCCPEHVRQGGARVQEAVGRRRDASVPVVSALRNSPELVVL